MTLSPSDQDLLDAITDTDPDAEADLYNRYRDWSLNLALSITRDHASAADAAQTAWVECIRRLRSRRVILTGRFTTFLYKYVKHAAIKAKRSHPGVRSDASSEHTTDTARQDDPALIKAVRALPQNQSEVLRLRYWHDMTDNEIATALSLPLGTVKGRLRSGLRALKASLEVDEHDS